jgi:prevent-host-death family protein
MDSISLSEAKANLSAIMDRVEAGEAFTVMRRGKPVGMIAPVAKPRKPIDWEEVRRIRSAMTKSTVESVVLIRGDAHY